MSLVGETLAHYRITAAIGAGGMGEVYRAADTRLGRDVAIKVLPAAFASDAERLARFEREAKLLAALNHAGIAHVYGFESTTRPDGTVAHFLAMELVEGEDLAARLGRGKLPLDDALGIARQVAEALEAAHEKAIVHRDLKPANVKLTPEGRVKVLDFGLAKAYAGDATSGSSADLSQSPTLAHTGTQAGLILGTAAYMSPEQARGRAVDRRADIWALGVLLFEMLAGRRPFGGETVSETLAAVIKDEPEWGALPAGVPAAVAGVLRRCLVKDPARRLHDVADARLLLEDAGPVPADAPPERAPRWRERLAWLLAVAGVGAALALAGRGPAAPAPPPLTQFSVPLPDDQSIALVDSPTLALSPDGRRLAFTVSGSSGQTLIHLRVFDQPAARPLPGTEGGSAPFFSPDGSALGFFAEGRMKTIDLAGGTVLVVAEAATARGGVWGPDGTILFSPQYAGGLWRVPASGGLPQPVLQPETDKGERTYRWPDLLPGGRVVLYTLGSLDSPSDYSRAQIVACSLDTGRKRVVVEDGSMARFVPPDRLVYSRGGILFAVAFDPERLEVVGRPVPALEGVSGDPSSGASYYSVALDGTLAFIRGGAFQTNQLLTLVDRSGAATPLPLSPRGFRHPQFSPDGTRLAFTVAGSSSGTGLDADVWTYSLAGGTLNRLTFGGKSYPAWAPDGRRIAYVGADQAVLAKSADGAGAEESLLAPAPDPFLPGSWSADGRTLALTRIGAVNEIHLLTLGQESRLFETDASSPAFSPDGRWIAYQSPAVAGNVFVRAVSGEGKWQVSSDSGSYPEWSGDGRELFYIANGNPRRPLMVVPIEKGESFRFGPPRVLVEDLTRYMTATAPQVDWDAAPDGRRFAFIAFERGRDEGTRVDVALHWARHLAVGRNGTPGR